jgi:hypothetical protein
MVAEIFYSPNKKALEFLLRNLFLISRLLSNNSVSALKLAKFNLIFVLLTKLFKSFKAASISLIFKLSNEIRDGI